MCVCFLSIALVTNKRSARSSLPKWSVSPWSASKILVFRFLEGFREFDCFAENFGELLMSVISWTPTKNTKEEEETESSGGLDSVSSSSLDLIFQQVGVAAFTAIVAVAADGRHRAGTADGATVAAGQQTRRGADR